MNLREPATKCEREARILALCEDHLIREESLVAWVLESLQSVRDSFLNCDLSHLPSLQARQRELLAAEQEIAPEREKLRSSLAPLLGISPTDVTLRTAALALAEPVRERLLRRHARLVEMVRSSARLRRHNASLLGYARGFLDCLLGGLTETSGGEGYGPQGERRGVCYGPFLEARV
jgi:hypothetical protein